MILFRNPQIIFVFSSLFIAVLGLAKSIIFAKYLPFDSLGLLVLFQSTMALVATFHFGILSGGYRLASFYSEEKFKELNSVIFSLLFFLFFIFIFLLVFIEFFGLVDRINDLTYLGLFAGCITLFSNWAMNISIAKGNLTSVNKAQLCGAIASVITVPLIFYFELYAAFAVVIIQPVVIIFFLIRNVPYTVPDSFKIDFDVATSIFKSGFYPFLAALFFITYQQLEKMLIGYTLSVESLGQLTLFYLTLTVWSILPDTLTRLYFPKATFFYENNNHIQFANLFKQHFFIIACYCLLCSFCVVYFTEPLVSKFLTQHVEFVGYVKLGVIAYTFKSLAENPAIRLLSMGCNNYILIIDALCFFTYFAVFLCFFSTGALSILIFIYLAILYYFIKLILLSFFSILATRGTNV